MSDQIGSYTFLPWLRVGLANRLASPAAGQLRATVPVTLRLEGDAPDNSVLAQDVHKDVPVYGPGDIVGIDRRAIIKTEPRNLITTFEPNYLPYVEFYDEDFTWRYSPEVPQGHRLRPWIMLVVLKEDEFENAAAVQGRPLPSIRVEGAGGLFPPFEQLWAWAHVHANRDLAAAATEIVSTDAAAFQARLESLLAADSDFAYSRLVCPRKLDVSSSYHAFIVPVYETGRLAGLGLDPAAAPAAAHGAWQDYPGREEGDVFPYYHRWAFQTGTIGDFEYLVRLLEPRPVDVRVGRRDIDVLAPGSNLNAIDDPELGGILRLGGALRFPLLGMTTDQREEYDKYENWDQAAYPHAFQTDLAAFVNLADDYQHKTAEAAHVDTSFDATIPDPGNPDERVNDPDPLITPPLYGRWHSLTPRLLTGRDGAAVSPNDNWVHELNLDPCHRTAAGFGTAVVQQNQEEYMNAAWEQVGEVIEANKRIRRAQFAKLTATRWHARSFLVLAQRVETQDRAVTLTLPVQKRVMLGGVTASFAIERSVVPSAVMSTATRRILRPRGRLMKALPFDAEHTPVNLVTRINAGTVTANPPKPAPAALPQLEDLAAAIKPANVPPWAQRLLARFPRLPLVLILAAAVALIIAVLLVGLFSVGGVILAALGIAVGALGVVLRRWQQLLLPAQSLGEANQTPEAVDRLPPSSDFRIIVPGESFRPSVGGSDSPTARRYKTALRHAYALQTATRESAAPVERRALDLRALATTVVTAIDPRFTIPRQTLAGVLIPPRIRDKLGERFVEAMAYPEIDVPMYKPLAAKSADYFVPNLDLIEQNTISLLEVNQPFIEAYMVGVNHEFARELLWREYPTDQRGSYFRQFWDVTGYLHDFADVDPAALREQLKDIPPLHLWSRASALGDHDHRDRGGDEAEIVLVIRGELLKKYPTAVIYAHRARWQRKPDGTIDNGLERRLEDPGAADAPNPSRELVKTPLYEAKVDPDIYFFGFDLTAQAALGDTGETEGDDPGWFFVIKERPGEPRFGLDIDTAEHVHVWNDLGWGNVVPGAQPGDYLQITPATPTIQLEPLPPSDNEQQPQATDDAAVKWHKDTDAAELAYILYQVPVLVAVHAAEMLPKPEA
jgi:hypothetical protein